MFIKTILLAVFAAVLPQKEMISIDLVKQEKSKDSSTETTHYEITPVSIVYTYSLTGRKAKKDSKTVVINKREYGDIRKKYADFKLNVNKETIVPADQHVSIRLTASAKFTMTSTLTVHGDAEQVRFTTEYKNCLAFISWLKTYKAF